MPMVLADVLKLHDSDYPDKVEVKSNYLPGQKVYVEYDYKKNPFEFAKAVAEFEVTAIMLNTLVHPHEVMLNLKTEDKAYAERIYNRELLIYEFDMEQHLAKNTEVLNEMRGQMAASLYTTGERYAHIELDNGRHLAINEWKNDDGTFTGNLKVSLYANSEEIQLGIFKNTHHIIRDYLGDGSVDFLYQSIKTALQVNGNIKTPKEYEEFLQSANTYYTPNTPLPSSPEIKRLADDSGFIISNAKGDSIKLNITEFWAIVQYGERMGTKAEIEEFSLKEKLDAISCRKDCEPMPYNELNDRERT